MRRRTEKAVFAVCAAFTLAEAVLIVYVGYATYYREYHAALLIAAMLLGALLSSALCCLFHELGHIVFGKLCGFRFHALHVWFFHMVRSGEKLRVWLGRMPEGEAGAAEMVPVSAEKIHARFALVTAGGPVFSLIWLVGALLALIFAPEAPFAVYVLTAASLPYAFYLFACNVLPFSALPTDGTLLVGILRGDASAQTAVNLLTIESHLMQGEAPSQIDEALYYGAPQLPEDDANFILLTDYRLARAIDAGDAEKAFALSDRLKGLTEYVPAYCRGEIAADVLFVECALRQDADEARRLYPAVEKYLENARELSAQRTAAAYALFVNADRTDCLRHLSAAQELADGCPVPGVVRYERKLLGCIKEELEHARG